MRNDLPVRALALIAVLGAALTAACGGDDADTSLAVSWTFDAGDCAANAVETVRVTWGPAGGATESVDFACADGQGTLGDTGSGGTFSIDAEGLDAAGVARAESYGQTVTVGGGGTGGMPIDVHLHPKGADVTVSWSLAGGDTCPPGVILPYFVTLYVAPAQVGGALTDDVAEAQESCTTGEVTLPGVAPGDYVAEVDSRAVQPALRGTAPVTVEAGQDAQVAVQF